MQPITPPRPTIQERGCRIYLGAIEAFVLANADALRENTSLLERQRELTRAISTPVRLAASQLVTKTYLRHASEPAGVTWNSDKNVAVPIKPERAVKVKPASKKAARKAEALARQAADHAAWSKFNADHDELARAMAAGSKARGL
jgi:hypothetical protein